MKQKYFFVVALALVAVTLAGCTAAGNPHVVPNPSGLLSGLWHGFIAPFTLFLSIFTDSISMYEVRNTGFGYNLGFLAGFWFFTMFFPWITREVHEAIKEVDREDRAAGKRYEV